MYSVHIDDEKQTETEIENETNDQERKKASEWVKKKKLVQIVCTETIYIAIKIHEQQRIV